MKLVATSFLLVVLLVSEYLHSQPTQQWQKVFDGIGWYDEPSDMCKDESGNYIIAGTSVISNINFSDFQLVFIKYDSLGNQIWVKSKNNNTSVGDEPYKIFIDDSSNFYSIGAFSFSEYIVKYNQLGDEIWFNFGSGFKDLEFDDLGNVYAAYSANNHAFVHKYNVSGESIWIKRFDSLSIMMSESVDLVSDDSSNFYLLGNKIVSASNSNFFIVKFDTAGNKIWYREYDTPFQMIEWMSKIIQDSENNLIAVGKAEVPNQFKDIYITKISSSGDLIWDQFINGQANYNDSPFDIVVDSENSIIVSGYVSKDLSSSYTTNQFITAKFDQHGVIVFKNIYCDSISLRGTGRLLQVDINDNIYSAGTISVDSVNDDNKILVLKYDKCGSQMWEIKKDVYSGSNYPRKIILNRENDFTITASCGGQIMPSNIVTFRFSDNPLSAEDSMTPQNITLNQNYPNPFNPSTTISYSIPTNSQVKIIVYDLLGKEVKTLLNEEMTAGEYQLQFDATGLSSGVYYYSIFSNDFAQTKKMILIK